MNSRASIVAVLCAMACAPAFAEWSVASRIAGIELEPGGDALISMEDMSANPANCGKTDVYRLSADAENFRRTYLLILASYLAQHRVRLGLAGESCEDAAPSVETIEMPY